MFLLKVFRYSKWLFAIMVGFSAIQITVFIKQGMVATPWFNFGMYSGRIDMSDEYHAYALQGKKSSTLQWLSPQREDQIVLALDYFNHQDKNKAFADEIVLPIGRKLHVSFTRELFQSDVSDSTFRKWFYPFAAPWVHIPANYNFKTLPAKWDGHRLQLSK